MCSRYQFCIVCLCVVCCQYLQMKVTRYEHLVQIKDMKIESLRRELEDARNAIRQTQLLQRPYQRR